VEQPLEPRAARHRQLSGDPLSLGRQREQQHPAVGSVGRTLHPTPRHELRHEPADRALL
jgi:hypothetical protein